MCLLKSINNILGMFNTCIYSFDLNTQRRSDKRPRVRLTPLNMLKTSSEVLQTLQGGASFVGLFI